MVYPKVRSVAIIIGVLVIVCSETSVMAADGIVDANYPARPKRQDSFLGIHFDFHAGNQDTAIGKTVTEEMVNEVIEKVRPDYIQHDCKGHPGFSSYPTKVGNPAPGVVNDPLKIWRKVTAEHGVSLYMHYSGVWDAEFVRLHPEAARVDENGVADTKCTSVFGPYVDQLLIPQLKELRDVYGVDGVWLDGECWALNRDYSTFAAKAFKESTGFNVLPKSPQDANYATFSEFCRQGFRDYLEHYVDSLHAYDGKFQIASNWAYSSFMPEPIRADVDFISGDFAQQNSFNIARFDARVMRNQGKPWDLMAWGFVSDKDYCINVKSAVQLAQEAAVVVALGGGFQTYYTQKRDASIYEWEMDVFAEVAKFCRARQLYCHKAEGIPQISVVFSRANIYHNSKRLFGSWEPENIDPVHGTLFGLLDNQYSVDVHIEHNIKGKMSNFPLIVLPECNYIEDDFKKQLLSYVQEGGNLLLVGPDCARLFQDQLNYTSHDNGGVRKSWLAHNGKMAGINGYCQSVTLPNDSKSFGELYPDNELAGTAMPAAMIRNYGKGKIAATFFNFGIPYVNARRSVARDWLGGLVQELFPYPMVKVTGSHNVDVVLSQYKDQLAINLVNTSGDHANKNVYVWDELPAVGPLHIIAKCEYRPKRVCVYPEKTCLEFSYSNGEANFVLPKLAIHSVVVLEK